MTIREMTPEEQQDLDKFLAGKGLEPKTLEEQVGELRFVLTDFRLSPAAEANGAIKDAGDLDLMLKIRVENVGGEIRRKDMIIFAVNQLITAFRWLGVIKGQRDRLRTHLIDACKFLSTKALETYGRDNLTKDLKCISEVVEFDKEEGVIQAGEALLQGDMK